MKTFFTLVVASALLCAAGCVTYIPAPPMTGDPVVDGHTGIAQGPVRDKVLWQYRTAVAEMRRGNYPDAKALLDDALLTSGGILQDKGAKMARSYFHEENRKTFIGEPYERVMAYYYRGILYWMDGEPDNARACFLSAQIQDSDTENKAYSADYVLLDYLVGLANVKQAGDGADALKRARAETRLATPPDYDAQANVLFFVEFGDGPRKYAAGQYREQLRFQDFYSPVRVACIKVAGQSLYANPYDDLYFQAVTRGGRVMDYVLANKAVFKATTGTVGNVALVTGAILAQNRSTQDAGLGLAAFGLVSKIVSATTTPAADTRMWESLPKFLSFAVLKLAPGQYPATVEFQDAGGHPFPAFTKTLTIEVKPGGQDTVIFVSDKK